MRKSRGKITFPRENIFSRENSAFSREKKWQKLFLTKIFFSRNLPLFSRGKMHFLAGKFILPREKSGKFLIKKFYQKNFLPFFSRGKTVHFPARFSLFSRDYFLACTHITVQNNILYPLLCWVILYSISDFNDMSFVFSKS